MKTIEFVSLLTEDRNGAKVGPMSPVSAANFLMSEGYYKNYKNLYRVHFNDERTLQLQDGDEGITHNDILLVVSEYEFDTQISLLIDTGTGLIPAACYYTSDADMIVSPLFVVTPFLVSLGKQDLLNLFNCLLAHISIP